MGKHNNAQPKMVVKDAIVLGALYLVSCNSLQMKESYFLDDQEMCKWATSKWDQFQDSKFPDKLHPTNWKFNERFFKLHKGSEVQNLTTLSELMERRAENLPAGHALLNIEPVGGVNSKNKSPLEKYKLAKAKLQQTMNRLGKSIQGCENNLGGFKRQLKQADYMHMKAGLNHCREQREDALDRLSDFPLEPENEDSMEKMMEEMSTLTKDLADSHQALTEAMATHKAPIKDEKDEKMEASENPEATETGPSQNSESPSNSHLGGGLWKEKLVPMPSQESHVKLERSSCKVLYGHPFF